MASCLLEPLCRRVASIAYGRLEQIAQAIYPCGLRQLSQVYDLSRVCLAIVGVAFLTFQLGEAPTIY